jgi:hypothetical protein
MNVAKASWWLFQVPRPLDNPLIFGNYSVVYVSTKNAPKQDGQREHPPFLYADVGFTDWHNY